jgi:hypothetical protein
MTGLCLVTDTIHPTPNLSCNIPNFAAQKVFANGITTNLATAGGEDCSRRHQ